VCAKLRSEDCEREVSVFSNMCYLYFSCTAWSVCVRESICFEHLPLDDGNLLEGQMPFSLKRKLFSHHRKVLLPGASVKLVSYTN